MTRTRASTALGLAIPVVPLILFLPTAGFVFLAAGIAALAGWEWLALDHDRTGWVGRLAYSLVIFLLVFGVWLIEPLWPFVMVCALGLWCVLLGRIVIGAGRGLNPSFTAGYGLGIAVIVPGPVALTIIHGTVSSGPLLVLVFCIIVWSGDIFAYLIGRAWGTRKLALAISPGKTLEGTLGGVAGAVVAGMLCYGLWHTSGALAVFNSETWLVMVISVSVVSVVGDLAESVVKRNAGQKDSGSLLPGHGGVLDRVDGLLSSAPILGVWLIALGVF